MTGPEVSTSDPHKIILGVGREPPRPRRFRRGRNRETVGRFSWSAFVEVEQFPFVKGFDDLCCVQAHRTSLERLASILLSSPADHPGGSNSALADRGASLVGRFILG